MSVSVLQKMYLMEKIAKAKSFFKKIYSIYEVFSTDLLRKSPKPFTQLSSFKKLIEKLKKGTKIVIFYLVFCSKVFFFCSILFIQVAKS